jgi:hypothetical protein
MGESRIMSLLTQGVWVQSSLHLGWVAAWAFVLEITEVPGYLSSNGFELDNGVFQREL